MARAAGSVGQSSKARLPAIGALAWVLVTGVLSCSGGTIVRRTPTAPAEPPISADRLATVQAALTAAVVPTPSPTMTAEARPTSAASPTPTWTPVPTQRPPSLTGHTATVLNDGRVMVTSWRDGARIFDPQTNEWESLPGIMHVSSNHTATVLNDGRVLIVGGYGSMVGEPGPAYIGSDKDPVRIISGPAVPHFFHGAVLLQDGRVLVAGNGPPDRSAEIFDPAKESWARAADMNVARALPRMVPLPDGRVLVAGGHGFGGRDTPISDVEIYDPVLDRWSMPLHAPETFQGVPVALSDGRVLLFGSHTWLHEPGTGNWTELLKPPGRECCASVTALRDGRVLVLGGSAVRWSGSTTDLRLTASAVVFDTQTAAWVGAPDLKAPRFNHEAVQLPDERVLVIGGMGDTPELPEIEFYSVPDSTGRR